MVGATHERVSLADESDRSGFYDPMISLYRYILIGEPRPKTQAQQALSRRQARDHSCPQRGQHRLVEHTFVDKSKDQ